MRTTTTATPLVEVRGLHTFYGNSHVLHGVDLQIAPGETLALLGRNGMGKSTTIRSLLGLTPARSGEVRIKGKDVTGSAPHQMIRRGIGYVPEGRGMFPNLTVRESLLMAARPGVNGRRGWSLDRVLETFPRLGERFAHLTGNLSGGEQQMVAIGRALMTNPELMILDEATEGLAPLIRKEIWEVIRLIKASGIATLVVDKNVNVLLDLADRSMIMVKGRVVYDGPSQDLKSHPQILRTHIGL
ncbi:ABC transporter ATP-binding protein [Halopseudomonas pelagia]|uniref:ABC transporter ATP-binding protein n=1 Tax=Halopseudomonas pelagia TaxID=553151 RepID=A0AA91U698_9GAMM|nr:ABC transporter ATP-binding protein [Halopseudomonas pelagia]PCD01423.1 ABC transporter ATP-binding protein [Halopseudomonas pelagia]QFY55002.1 ABC transporter ATP-binding protein [Halopseudomonas pelagia]